MKKAIRKYKRKIKRAPKTYIQRLFKQIKKDPLESLIWILIGPFLVYYIATIIFSFSTLAMIGYIFACLIGLTEILKKPSRILIWGVGYIIASLVVFLFFNLFIPNASGEDAADVFATAIILYAIITLWIKSRDLRKK